MYVHGVHIYKYQYKYAYKYRLVIWLPYHCSDPFLSDIASNSRSHMHHCTEQNT